MRFLVDENVPKDIADLLVQHGHDVLFMPGSELASSSDLLLLDVCRRENRYLLTLDKGIPDTELILPTGVLLIRAPRATQPDGITAVVASHVNEMVEDRLRGRITIVEAGRLRHRPMPEP